jgi:hypothetical protein
LLRGLKERTMAAVEPVSGESRFRAATRKAKMGRARKPKPSRATPEADETAFLTALSAPTELALAAALPGDAQLQVDIHVCLLDAMSELPIARSDIGADTVPSKTARLDVGAWGICLARFEGRLRQFRPIYLFYVHKPRYTQETFDKRFPEIVLYLKLRILAQFSGTEP